MSALALTDDLGPLGRRRARLASVAATATLAAGAAAVVWRFAERGQLDAVRWRFFVRADVVRFLAQGLLTTLQVGATAAGLSLAAGALLALGLTFPQTLQTVVLPQALRTVVAPLGSLFIASVKNSSVAFTISVRELVGQSDHLITETAQTIPVLLGAVAAFLLLTLPAGLAVGALERRVAIKR